MSEYRIEKIRHRVSVFLTTGETLEGDIFLQPTARYRTGPQDPSDLLNEADAYIPLATSDDSLVILAKDQITRVQYEPSAADTDSGGAADAAVDVVFADGTRFSGQLRLETRSDRSRLLDFLNGDHQRFLTLRSSGMVCLANRGQISQVWHRH